MTERQSTTVQSPDRSGQASRVDDDNLLDTFESFQALSGQLNKSYQDLEHRVADLTEELDSALARREQEQAEKDRLSERMQTLLSVLPAGVVIIDRRGLVVEANPVALSMLGEPLKGASWRSVIGRNFRPKDDDGHEISTKDGRRFSVATSSLAGEGQIILLTDQTETRRLQSELSRHERLSALGKMVSALAHQIRTPLSTAMLYAGHLCGEDIDRDQQKQFSQKLLKRLKFMERQVQDMLVFVKGDLPMTETVTVAELRSCLLEEVEILLSSHDARCRWYIDCPDRRLRCHKESLIGAISNLVHNAIQAAGNGLQLDINFSLTDDGYLTICVKDDGPGMDAQLMSRVKELFVTTKSQGTGIGLAVVETISKRHGGKFELSSKLGHGVEATICLPLIDSRSSQSHGHELNVSGCML